MPSGLRGGHLGGRLQEPLRPCQGHRGREGTGTSSAEPLLCVACRASGGQARTLLLPPGLRPHQPRCTFETLLGEGQWEPKGNERSGEGSPSLAVVANLLWGLPGAVAGARSSHTARSSTGPGRPRPGAWWACGLPAPVPHNCRARALNPRGVGVQMEAFSSPLWLSSFSERRVGVLEAGWELGSPVSPVNRRG